MSAADSEKAIRALKPRFSKLTVRRDNEGRWTAEVRSPFSRVSFSGLGRSEAEAGLSRVLAMMRLPATLAAAGWTVTDRIVDEVEVITATSPHGVMWGIAVGDASDTRLIDFVRSTAPACEAFAVVEPIATRDPSSLREALPAEG